MDNRVEFLKNADTGFITDAMGLVKTGSWMRGIYPANPDMRVAGRAFTVQFSYITEQDQFYYKHMFDLFPLCQPGDIMVISAREPGAMTGEHVIHGAKNNRLGGMVIDGFVRDFGGISAMDFATFCAGREIGHTPGNYKATAVNIPIQCGGITVNPGDYIVGDIDGVIAIPEDKIDAVIFQAEKVAEIERKMTEILNRNDDTSNQDFLQLSKEKKILRE